MTEVKNARIISTTECSRKDRSIREFKALNDFLHYNGNNIPKVYVSQQNAASCQTFSDNRLDAKKKANNTHYSFGTNGTGDGKNATYRGGIGAFGEAGIGQDCSDRGFKVSINYEVYSGVDANPDVYIEINGRKFPLGVKSCSGRNLPVISRSTNHKYPQVFCYIEHLDDGGKNVHILGVAYPKVLNHPNNRTDDGIADPNMLDRKTAFKGFRWLTPWETYISRIKAVAFGENMVG